MIIENIEALIIATDAEIRCKQDLRRKLARIYTAQSVASETGQEVSPDAIVNTLAQIGEVVSECQDAAAHSLSVLESEVIIEIDRG